MRGDKHVRTIDELIDLVAFGDIHEVGYVFNDDPEGHESSQVRLPYNRPEELAPGGPGMSPEEEIRVDLLAILVAFREKRLCKGGWVASQAWDSDQQG